MVASLVDRGPYHRPDRVVGLQLTAPSLLYPRIYFANEDYIALRNSTVADDGIFDALLPLGIAYVMMTGGGEPSHLNAGVMPAETFARLGVQPLLGRPLGAGDERPDATAVVVISEEVWRRHLVAIPPCLAAWSRLRTFPTRSSA